MTGNWSWPDDPKATMNERIAAEVAAANQSLERMKAADPGAPVVARKVRFVCTDGATHATREIGLLTRYYDDEVALPGDALQPASARVRRGKRDESGRTPTVKSKARLTHEGRGILLSDAHIELTCPTCKACIQWRIMRAIKIVDTLVASGRFVVDVSALPANLR